jgi:hypothetical protein
MLKKKLPEGGILVPKHVASSIVVGAYIGWYIN